jgi:hypothetical protein
MKNNKWVCPLTTTAAAAILLLYGHFIPANIFFAIGIRSMLQLLIGENDVKVSSLLREMHN